MKKVVFHVDEMEKWNLTMANATNFYNQVEGADIAIVANAEAVNFLDVSKHDLDRLRDLQAKGIKLYGCKIAMKNLNFNMDQLLKDVILVSGVVELAKKQAEGYAYIRP